MRRLAEAGANPIVMAGFSQATPLSVVAPDYPDTTFVIIDGVVDEPNVRSVIFSEHEGSYLVGMLAAMASETGTVGFVGGMDIPLISRFACGYAQGGRRREPRGDRDRKHDRHHARRMERPGARWRTDPRADRTRRRRGLCRRRWHGPWRSAGGRRRGHPCRSAWTATSNYLHPGSVLTSMLKRVDVAVHDAFTTGPEVETGIHVFGLAEEGVGYALDEFNAELISEEMMAAVDAARASIHRGRDHGPQLPPTTAPAPCRCSDPLTP